METAVERLSGLEGILIFCDLAGGSPFNIAIQLKMSRDSNMEVVGGANIPMLIEILMLRQNGGNLEELTKLAVSTGKEQIIRFVKTELGEEYEYDE